LVLEGEEGTIFHVEEEEEKITMQIGGAQQPK